MNITILGSGKVARALADRLAAAGHALTLGVRKATSDSARAAAAAGLRVLPLEEAAAGAGVVIVATPWSAAEAVVRAAQPRNCIVVDATNAYRAGPDGITAAAVPAAADQFATWLPGLPVVKAFNQTGAANLADPGAFAQRPVMFVCGNDGSATTTVLELAHAAGFDAVNAGDLRAARHLEALAHLWMHLAYVAGHGDAISLAFQRRQVPTATSST